MFLLKKYYKYHILSQLRGNFCNEHTLILFTANSNEQTKLKSSRNLLKHSFSN